VTVGRRLRAAALIVTIIAAAIGGSAAVSADSTGATGSTVTAPTVCAGRATTASASGACTSSVVTPTHVARSSAPFRRASAGAWTATPRPAMRSLLAVLEAGEVASCPRPPPAHNQSRAPPSP
jgi:hypothetical protein